MNRPSSAADLRLRVLDAVRREPTLSRPQASRRRAWLLVLGFAGTGLIAVARRVLEPAQDQVANARARSFWHAVSTTSPNLPHRPLPFLFSLELAWLLIAVFATWSGIVRGRSMLGRSPAIKLGVAFFTPLALVTTWLLLARAQLPTLDETPDSLLHLHCALMSVAYAMCPLVAFFAVRRGTDPTAPRSGGAAIGAVAGVWGSLFYVASCDCTSPVHVALAHALPITLLALLGALVGERVLGFEA